MTKLTQPQNQDIYIIAPSADAAAAADDQHPEKGGAQDIVIGNTNGILYHVAVKTWKNDNNKVPFQELPSILQQMYLNGTVLAHLPLDPPDEGSTEAMGYYLANFAILNNERPTTTTTEEPPGSVYRLPMSAWFDDKQPLNHMFWPGNSVFLLEVLNRGSAIAYISRAARTMDCFCYLLNLASLNGKEIFVPTSATNPKCEVRTDGTDSSG